MQRRGLYLWDQRSLSFGWVGTIAVADLPSHPSPGLKKQRVHPKMMNMLLMACAVVGWSKVIQFAFITSLKTHLKCEKSGVWDAGAVPRGLTVGNSK